MNAAHLLLYLFASAFLARAQLTSNIIYSVVVSNHPIFDASLSYRSSTIGDETNLLEMRIRHLANGRIGGTGLVAYANMNYEFTGHGDLHGRYLSLMTGDRCAFGFRTRISGTNTAGAPVRGTYEFDGLFLQRSGSDFFTSGTNVVCLRGDECTASDEHFYDADPRARDWKLSLNLQTSAEHIRGTGELLLIGFRFYQTNFLGRTLKYSAHGHFNKHTQQSVIHLRGIGEDRGSVFVIRGNGSFEIESIRGRALGQRADSDGPFEVVP
jgi:hypothetical protein